MKIASNKNSQNRDGVTREREGVPPRSVPVSIVIPVLNEEHSLPKLMASLAAQTVLPAEIILVDGGSTDNTVALAQKIAAGLSTLRVIEAKNATPGRGRNIGTAAARTEWVAFTDAGLTLEPQWLERLFSVTENNPEVTFVYGNFEPVVDSFFTRCASLAYVSPKQKTPRGLIRAPFIASSLLRRDLWQQVGGFPDLRAAEDLIFMEAIEKNQASIDWAPQATAWWRMQPTLRQTYERFKLYSRCNVWAGRQRFWHYGIARAYLLALVFILLSALHSWWWLVILVLVFSARVAKRIWNRREGKPLLSMLNPFQFAGVAIIMMAIDFATFVGWIQARKGQPTVDGAIERSPNEL